MSRIFDEKGNAIAVTALEIEPTVVTQIKTQDKDGYVAIQLGCGAERHPSKPQQGHTKSLGHTPKYFAEYRLEEAEEYAVGQVLDHTLLAEGNRVKITGVSKGKGFAGVIKRHGFRRGPETHGSDHHRAPGSIGSMFPQHVWKGKRMPGHAGNTQVTSISTVVDILPNEKTILIKGQAPGSRGSLLQLTLHDKE